MKACVACDYVCVRVYVSVMSVSMVDLSSLAGPKKSVLAVGYVCV